MARTKQTYRKSTGGKPPINNIQIEKVLTEEEKQLHSQPKLPINNIQIEKTTQHQSTNMETKKQRRYTGYIMYMQTVMPLIKKKPDIAAKDRIKIIAKMWGELSGEEKQIWKNKAKQI